MQFEGGKFMVNIILASHGEFAEGILQSAEMIFGEQDQLVTATLMPNEGPDDLKAKYDEAIESFGEDAEVLFMVDLWGGSPFNQASMVQEEMSDRSAIVTGLNLPMLLEALGARAGVDSAHELASQIVTKDVSGIRVKPEDLEPAEEGTAPVETEENSRPVGTLEPGTVVGDGKIDYVLVRIDTRLLHGQVSTNWVRAVNPNRIIVVSDKVAQDEMRKTLIQQAAPSGIRTHTIPVSKLAEIDDDPRFGATRALILFESPQEVLEAVELGVEFEHINIGSMAHSQGKTMINNSISVDEEDVQTLQALEEHGITFDVKKLPGDSSGNLNALLKKEDLI